MPEKLTFTEEGKVYGTSDALWELWKKRDEMSTKMKQIPLCG
jgi:hypothetical protein